MDIASLGIKIDTSDAATAVTDLDKVTQSGAKAEKAAEGVAAGFEKASSAANDLATTEKKLAESTDDAKTRLLAMAKASLESSEYVKSLTTSTQGNTAALDAARSSGTDYVALQKRFRAESDALVGTTDKAAASARQAAAATGVQAEGLQALLAKINPVAGALGKLDEQQAQLQKYKNAGVIDAETFKDYSSQIEVSRQKTAGLSDGLGKVGVSAKQTAAALRGVPAQFTDIATSLQGGQSPLTVLLQQGGQLKDMFGGIGPAAKALGGYVIGLVTPLTVAAAAAAVLGVAYYKGSQEADAYNKSLILTGNYAGVSAGQLGEMAGRVSATVGSTGAAAEALASLAGGGKIASESFVEITKAAVSMQEATGKAISETISEFVKLADDPVKASIALNDQYHYLTESVYSQIAALEQQGNHADAVKLATNQYAFAISERTPKILENLSLWEKGYNAVARAADGLKNIGRSSSDSEMIASAQKSLDLLQKGVSSVSFNNKTYSGESGAKELKGLIDFMGLQADGDKSRIKFLGDADKAQSKAIAAAEKIDAGDRANLTTAQKRNKLLDEYQKQLVDIMAVNASDSRLNPDAVASHIQGIKDNNKDPAGKANQLDLTAFNDAQNSLKTLQDTYSNTEKQLDASQKAGLISASAYATQKSVLIKAEKEEVTAAYEAEISALEAVKDKSGTTAEQRISLDQKIADARTSMVKAQKDADSQQEVLAANETRRLKKQTEAIKTYSDALQQQVDTLRQQGLQAAAGLGQGDRQRGLTEQLNGIDNKTNTEQRNLASQYGDGSRGMSLDEYNAKLGDLKNSQQALRDTAVQNYDDMSKAQGDWTSGASSAWQNYLNSAHDVAGQTKSLFGNAFSSMEDAVVNFAMTGKLSFADFAKSIIADMARIATRQASSSVLSSLFGMVAPALAGGTASAGSTSAGYSGDLSSFTPVAANANGGVYSGPGISSYSSSVVSKPTLFPFAKGTGLMGEAGPEAIMPLTRGANGKLGVQAIGGGGASAGSGVTNITVNVAKDGSTSVEADTQFGLDAAQAIRKSMIAVYKEQEAKSSSFGGAIFKANQGKL